MDAVTQIKFQCPKCGKRISVPTSAAGKTGKCPGCGTPVTVPKAPSPTSTQVGAGLEEATDSTTRPIENSGRRNGAEERPSAQVQVPAEAPRPRRETPSDPAQATVPAQRTGQRRYPRIAFLAVLALGSVLVGVLIAHLSQRGSRMEATGPATPAPPPTAAGVPPQPAQKTDVDLVPASGAIADANAEPFHDPTPSTPAPGTPKEGDPSAQATGGEEDVIESSKAKVAVIQTDRSHGSGLVVDPKGLVVTNYHLVRGAHSIAVDAVLAKTRTHLTDVTVIAIDLRADLAVLQLPAPEERGGEYPCFELRDEPALREGERVIAIGNPLQPEHSVTLGVVGGAPLLEKGIEYVRTSAAENAEDGGGPLLDTKGRVVGVVTSRPGDAQGAGVAVAAKHVRQLLDGVTSTCRVTGSLAEWEATHTDAAERERILQEVARSVASEMTRSHRSLAEEAWAREASAEIATRVRAFGFDPTEAVVGPLLAQVRKMAPPSKADRVTDDAYGCAAVKPSPAEWRVLRGAGQPQVIPPATKVIVCFARYPSPACESAKDPPEVLAAIEAVDVARFDLEGPKGVARSVFEETFKKRYHNLQDVTEPTAIQHPFGEAAEFTFTGIDSKDDTLRTEHVVCLRTRTNGYLIEMAGLPHLMEQYSDECQSILENLSFYEPKK